MRVLGIDEAGRGCVLGALVVAGFAAELDAEAALVAAGAGDSKRLSKKRREAARTALTPLGDVEIRRITPAQIDAGNLNRLEEDAIVSLIEALRPDHVILDALGHPRTLPALIDRLTARLAHLPTVPTILCEPKADHNHPHCGAASIFAKTTRDQELHADTSLHGDLGSGYPSDPKTRAWLSAHAATQAPWPSFVRTRWQTVIDLTAEARRA